MRPELGGTRRSISRYGTEGGPSRHPKSCQDAQDGRRKDAININFPRSARISWIGAGPPFLCARSAPGAAPEEPPGGPTPIQEIRANLRKFMFMAFFSSMFLSRLASEA